MASRSLYTPLNSQIKLVWFYGPTGSGKSHLAHKKYPGAFFKQANCDFKNYAEQETVVIEDLALSARRPFLLNLVKWLDPQPFHVTSNYKKIFIRPKKIVVCSYNHPCDFKHLKPFIPKILNNCRIIYCGNNDRSRSKSPSPSPSSPSDLEDAQVPYLSSDEINITYSPYLDS